MGKSLWDIIPSVVESVALTATGNPELIPFAVGATQGITKGAETGDPLKGLVSGVTSGVGSYAGGALGSSFGSDLAGLGSTANSISGGSTPSVLGSTFGDTFGDFAGNSIGGQTLGSLAGNSLGSAVGGSVGQDVADAIMPDKPDLGGTGIAGFSPSKQPSLGLPQSLSQFGNLDPNQQATNIASKGVYGGGNGPDEQNYFLNLINRQLFDSSGNVAQNTNGLAPVDMSYLNQLGISGSSPTDYLKGISQFGT